MSDDDLHIDAGGGIVNAGLEADTSNPKSESMPRFRISKPPAYDETLEMMGGASGDAASTNSGSSGVERANDVVQETNLSGGGSGSGEKSEKHVQLHLPSNYNDTVSNNRNTHTNTQTMGYLTHDAVPLSVFYRNQESMENIAGGKRPTLDQLHKGQGLENAKKRHWVSFIVMCFVWSSLTRTDSTNSTRIYCLLRSMHRIRKTRACFEGLSFA